MPPLVPNPSRFFVVGGLLIGLLPGVIESAPAGALVCVFHTATLIYFGHEKVAELRKLLAGIDRDVAWIGGEAPGVLVDDPGRHGPSLHFALVAGRPGRLEQVGRMGHHGGWLQWL